MASLGDAEDALRSTRSKANFQRLTRLLMCGGLRLLTETFDSIISPANLPSKLSDPATEAALKKARTTKPEWDKLYPSPGVYGKSTDFDITLIFRLLRTVCNLTPPPGPRGWDNLPNSSDHSLEADLVRIKYYRNEVYGHKKTMEISDFEFVDLWRNVSETLVRIAATIGGHVKKDEWKKAIHEFLVNPLTPEEKRYIEELDMWYKQDMDVKIEVVKLGDTIEERFETLTEDMRAGHDSIQEEVRSFRQEMEQSPRPVYITGPAVVIQIVNTVESVTQAGLPITFNRLSGRPQIAQEAGSERSCIIPIHPGHEQAAGSEGSSGELPLNQQDLPTEIRIWNVILSAKETFDLFLQYLGYKLNVFVRSHDVGSLLITVECSSLQILKDLWEDYHSGHLSEITQEILVTKEVLEKLGLDEVKLKTFISEEEYEKGKQIFIENSDYLQKISRLEKENNELWIRIEAIENTLQGKKEDQQQRKESRKMVQLERKIIELESRLSVELRQLKDEVRLTRKQPEKYQTRKYHGKPFGHRSFAEKRPLPARGTGYSSLPYSPISSLVSPLFDPTEEYTETLGEGYSATAGTLWGTREKLPGDYSSGKDSRPPGSPPLVSPRYPPRVPTEVPRMERTKQLQKGESLEARKGFCQIIVNREKYVSEDVSDEERELKRVSRVFQTLGFVIDKKDCRSTFDVDSVINLVAWENYTNNSSFVCFILSIVTKNGEIVTLGGQHLSFTKLMAKFSSVKCSTLITKPKIFIILGLPETTELETDEPVEEKSFTFELPSEENFLCLFVPYGKGYISTLKSVIESYGSSRNFLFILSEAKKLFYEKSNITIPDPVHNFKGNVYLK